MFFFNIGSWGYSFLCSACSYFPRVLGGGSHRIRANIVKIGNQKQEPEAMDKKLGDQEPADQEPGATDQEPGDLEEGARTTLKL